MEKNLVLSRAKSAAIARDFPLAIKLYKSLLKEDPSDLEVLNQLGSNYVKSGDDEKALLYYEQILTFSPHNIDAMNSMGAIYRRLKRYNESINILQRGLDEDANTVSVQYNLGFTYKEMGDFEDAIEAFKSVIDENPDDVLAHNHLGSIFYQQKDYTKSIDCFKKGLQVDPNHPILQYNLAKCYEAVNQYVDAVTCYEKALKARPGWTEALCDFSELLIKCQKTDEARAVVKRTIDLNPNDAKLYMLLGEIFLNEYDYDSAISSFKQADSFESNNVRILTGLAEAFEKGEHPEEAMEIMDKAMKIEPVTKDVEKQYVHTCLSAEEYQEAYNHVDSLYQDSGENDAQVLDLYGQYYICVGDEDNAKKYFDKIPSVDPEYKLYLLEAANRYSQIGKIREAEDLAKKYISEVPTDANAYNSLGKIYEQQGETKAAAQSFDQAMKISKSNVYAKNKRNMLGSIGEGEKDLSWLDQIAIVQEEETDVAKDLKSIHAALDDSEETFDFSDMIDTSFENINDIEPIAKDESVVEAEKYLDQPDPDLDAVYQDYPNLPKNPGAIPPHYPDSTGISGVANGGIGTNMGSSNENISSGSNGGSVNDVQSAMNDFAQKAAEYEKNLQDKFDEQSKQLEEKAQDLINKVEDASEKAEENRVVDELKENIADAFEDKIAEVMEEVDSTDDDFDDDDDYVEAPDDSTNESEKKEFDFDGSDDIIEDESESGETDMVDEEIVHNDDFGFADVDELFDSSEETEVVECDTSDTFGDVENLFGDEVDSTGDEEFGSVDDLFAEEKAEVESELVLDEEENFTSVDDLLGEKTESESETVDDINEEESFTSVDDLLGDEIESEVETANDTSEENFTSVDDLLGDEPVETEIVADEESFSTVDDLLDDDEPCEEIETVSEEPELETEESELKEIEEVEELEELLDDLTDDEIQANIINEDAPFEDIITAAAEVANEDSIAERYKNSEPKDSFDFLDPLATVRKFLPNIERILQDTDYAHAHSTELDLFIKMKQFCEFLPGNELDKYRNSKIRMLLDYLIARFSGKPGLLITAESLMKAGLLGEGVMEQVYEKEIDMPYEDQVRTVLEYMKKLTEGLTSRRTAEALCAEADKILEELELKKL